MENQNDENRKKETDELKKGDQIKYPKENKESQVAEHPLKGKETDHKNQKSADYKRSDEVDSLPTEPRDDNENTEENNNSTLHS